MIWIIPRIIIENTIYRIIITNRFHVFKLIATGILVNENQGNIK